MMVRGKLIEKAEEDQEVQEEAAPGEAVAEVEAVLGAGEGAILELVHANIKLTFCVNDCYSTTETCEK